MSGVLDHEFARDEEGRMFGFFLFGLSDATFLPNTGWFSEGEVDECIENRVSKRAMWSDAWKVTRRPDGRFLKEERVSALVRIHYDPARIDPKDENEVTIWGPWRSPFGRTTRDVEENGWGCAPMCNGPVFVECDPELLVGLSNVIRPASGAQTMITGVEFI